jgi:MFS family permease
MTIFARVRQLPPLIRRLAWVSFFTDASSDMIYPLLPAFLATMGAGAQALGIVEGVAESVSALVKWWTGRLSDRSPRRKPFVVGGYGIATLVRPLLCFATAPWHVVFIRTVDRFGKGLRSAPRDALVAATITPERRGLAFGFHRMMDNAGAVVGPAMAFMLASWLGWPMRWIFAVAIVPGLLAMATLVFGVKEPDAGAGKADKAAGGGDKAVAGTAKHEKLDPRVRRYLLVVAIFTLAGSADSFLILRLIDVGLDKAWAPLAWLTLNAFKALTNIPGGALSDRIGRRRTLALAWVVYALAYLAFPLTRSVPLTWALLIAYGAYYGLAEGGEKAIVADLAPASQRGRAFGSMQAITGIAVLPANLLFGLLYARNPAWAFWATGGLALVAVGMLVALVPKGAR